MNKKIYIFSNDFKKYISEKYKIQLLSKEHIGSGACGKVYKVRAKIVKNYFHDNSKFFENKEFDFAIKEYDYKSGAIDSLKVYKCLMKANINTWEYFYISKDRFSNLMPIINDKNELLIAGNDTLDKYFNYKINCIDNFSNLLEEMFTISLKAAKEKLFLEAESIFFIINLKTNNVRFLYGDLNHVDYNKCSISKCFSTNIFYIYFCLLKMLIYSNIEKRDKYLNEMIDFTPQEINKTNFRMVKIFKNSYEDVIQRINGLQKNKEDYPVMKKIYERMRELQGLK